MIYTPISFLDKWTIQRWKRISYRTLSSWEQTLQIYNFFIFLQYRGQTNRLMVPNSKGLLLPMDICNTRYIISAMPTFRGWGRGKGRGVGIWASCSSCACAVSHRFYVRTWSSFRSRRPKHDAAWLSNGRVYIEEQQTINFYNLCLHVC